MMCSVVCSVMCSVVCCVMCSVVCSMQCGVHYAVWCAVLTPLLSQAHQVEQACVTMFEMQRFGFPVAMSGDSDVW